MIGNLFPNNSFHSFAAALMELRNRIQEKASELFMRFGIRSISMDDIAGSLGISKKTIYLSFADKDELVDAMIEQHILQAEKEVDSYRVSASNAVEEIFMTMQQVEKNLRNLNPIVLHDLQKFHGKAYQRIVDHKELFLLNVIRENIKRGMKEGFYREDLQVEILSRYRMESMMVLFDLKLFPPADFNLADVSQVTLEHFLYGLATLKGHDQIARYKQNLSHNKSNSSSS